MLDDFDRRRSSLGDCTEREVAGLGSACELVRILERAIGPEVRLGVFVSVSEVCRRQEASCKVLTPCDGGRWSTPRCT